MNDNNPFLTLFLAPVAVYLEDDSVSEILINGPKQVYIEREEESAFEKRIRNYEYAAVASIVIFLLCFFTVPFVKDRIQ